MTLFEMYLPDYIKAAKLKERRGSEPPFLVDKCHFLQAITNNEGFILWSRLSRNIHVMPH